VAREADGGVGTSVHTHLLYHDSKVGGADTNISVCLPPLRASSLAEGSDAIYRSALAPVKCD
jgi:hypothetical protein